MIKKLFLLLIAILLLSKSGLLPEPIVEIVEQVAHVLLGILFIATIFLIAPVWVGVLSAVVVGAWLYMETPTQVIVGNGNGDTAQNDCTNNPDPCCGESGLCMVITGQPESP